MNCLLPYTACLACDVRKLQIHPIFSGRKLSCFAPSPGLPADETLVVQTAFYPTWRVSALTCEIHKLWTVPYNQHSQSMLIPLVEEGRTSRTAPLQGFQLMKHLWPPSPPVTTRYTHLFHETHTLAGTTHPILPTCLCAASSLGSLPLPNLPLLARLM